MRRNQAGLSLVELMIATVLGLLLVAMLTELFAGVTQTNREMAKTNSQIESARFTLQLLRNDIVHAGFWGPHVPEFDDVMYSGDPNDVPLIVPDPCLAFANWDDATTPGHVDALLGIPIQTYQTPPASCAGVITNRLAGTDVLIVRHAEQCAAGTGNCDPNDPGELYFQASNCWETELSVGSEYEFLDPNSYLLTERDCVTPAEKLRFVQNIYYIRNFGSTAGDGIPTLVRSEFDSLVQQPAQALVQGIEQLRVELGIDDLSETGAAVVNDAPVDWQDPTNWTVPLNRGDGVPDHYEHCTVAGTAPCELYELRNVTAVKVYVLARAEQATPGYTDNKSYQLGGLNVAAPGDGFKRHVFSNTVRINNIAGRRETP